MQVLARLQASPAVLSQSLHQDSHALALQADLAGQRLHLDAVIPQQLQIIEGFLSHWPVPALRLVVLALLLQLLHLFAHQGNGGLQLIHCSLPVLNL